MDVTAGSSSDVVVHRPAEVSGDPVVNLYRTPRSRSPRKGAGPARPHRDRRPGRRPRGWPGGVHRHRERRVRHGRRRVRHPLGRAAADRDTTQPILGPLPLTLAAEHGDDGLRGRTAQQRLDERDPAQCHAHLERRHRTGDDRHRVRRARRSHPGVAVPRSDPVTTRARRRHRAGTGRTTWAVAGLAVAGLTGSR